MSRRLSESIGLALLVAVTASTAAFAEDTPAASAAPATAAPATTDAPAATAPAGSAAAEGTPGPAGSAKASSGGLTGYAYGGHSSSSSASTAAPAHHRGLLKHHADEAVAKFTGFEMLADGGSRLFVQLTKQVDVEPEKADPAPPARKGKRGGKAEASVVSRLRFVLKGAEIVNPMNEGSLVTVHFNTPVVRAKLVPKGKNLALMVELRADVTPEVKFVAAKDNGSMLQIDFPQGSYLPAGAAEPAPQAPTASSGPPGMLPGTAPPAAGASDSAESK